MVAKLNKKDLGAAFALIDPKTGFARIFGKVTQEPPPRIVHVIDTKRRELIPNQVDLNAVAECIAQRCGRAIAKPS